MANGAERTIPLSPQKFDEVGRVTVHPDGNGVIMLGKAHGAAFVQIWQLFRDGSQRTVTSDLSDYRELSLRRTVARLSLFRHKLSRDSGRCEKVRRNRLRSDTGTSRYYDLAPHLTTKLSTLQTRAVR